MSAPQMSLLARRRFAPLFATQFLGAFNDNLFRSAMLFLRAPCWRAMRSAARSSR